MIGTRFRSGKDVHQSETGVAERSAKRALDRGHFADPPDRAAERAPKLETCLTPHEKAETLDNSVGAGSRNSIAMRAIFLSYRRDDSEGEAGRLFDDLAGHFGEDSVFMDVAAIEAGRDFRKAIDESVATCGVLLAVIGREWTEAKNEVGQRRLDDPSDFVRLETASALKRDIPVIPVLVHNAKMPRADQLPDDLKELAYRNGVELSHARWNSDVQLLIKALRPHVEDPKNVAGREPSTRVSEETKVPQVETGATSAAGKKSLWIILALVVLIAGASTVLMPRILTFRSAGDKATVQRAAEQKALAEKEGGNRAAPETPPALSTAGASAATQDAWRYCRKCHLMFYDGYPDKGRCAAGDGHLAQGFNFILPYDVPETPLAQSAWRYCEKCHAMFFDGFADKGVCAGGGGHVAEGFRFVLPHDVPPRGAVQAAWRYCEKCHAMFFDGYSDKGRCPAGGGHTAAGFDFVLGYHGI